jgi:hypothetical protein
MHALRCSPLFNFPDTLLQTTLLPRAKTVKNSTFDSKYFRFFRRLKRSEIQR